MSEPRTPQHLQLADRTRSAGWFAARLSLALKRTQRFTRWWGSVGGLVLVVSWLLPLLVGDGHASSEDAEDPIAARIAADTVELAQRIAALTERQRGAAAALAAAQGRAREASVVARVPESGALTSPVAAALQDAIARAEAADATDAYLMLADAEAIRLGPRLRATADSLRRAVGTPDERRFRRRIGSIARNRLAELGGALPEPGARSTGSPAVGPAVASLAPLRERATALADSVRVTQREREQRIAALSQRMDERQPTGPRVNSATPRLGLAVFLVLGLVVPVGSALIREMRTPTLAHAAEAEQTVRVRVATVARDAMPDGPPRFTPSGVDTFRVLYLSLTATGTRARSLIVVGDDARIVAAAAARLAIAAAADHRSTLVVDLDATEMMVSRVFREEWEPGSTDALTGTIDWRACARPLGARDGLALALVPAGSDPTVFTSGRIAETAQHDFSVFRRGYEFTILVASESTFSAACALTPEASVVLCGTIGETPVERFSAVAQAVGSAGKQVQNLVLWDAPPPTLPSRAELSALLSKQKGKS